MAFKFTNIQAFIRGIIEPHIIAVDAKFKSLTKDMIKNTDQSTLSILASQATITKQLIKVSTELTSRKINPEKYENCNDIRFDKK